MSRSDERSLIAVQHQIIKNFKNVLEEAGSSLEKIVKINIFLADMGDFPAMNEVYTQYFKKPNLPCRTYVNYTAALVWTPLIFV